ncbi:hypothetical protein PMIN06_011063 [Paraphaeosphaeria minitans]
MAPTTLDAAEGVMGTLRAIGHLDPDLVTGTLPSASFLHQGGISMPTTRHAAHIPTAPVLMLSSERGSTPCHSTRVWDGTHWSPCSSDAPRRDRTAECSSRCCANRGREGLVGMTGTVCTKQWSTLAMYQEANGFLSIESLAMFLRAEYACL